MEEHGREIMTGKFRVWDGKKMWYPGHDEEKGFYLSQEGELMEEVWVGDGIGASPGAKAMFSTGHTVKDKDGNDRELYKGDIVELDYAGDDWPGFSVQYNPEYCGWYLYLRGKAWLPISTNLNNMTILGNRYENVKLLEGGAE